MTRQSLCFDCRAYGLELSLEVHMQAGWIVEVEFVDPPLETHFDRQDDQQQRVIEQLEEYFSGRRHCFELPIETAGSDFQQRVWQRMQLIPFGEVRSYGHLAGQLASSARAVGGACRANPVPLFIPCHRVVAANGIGGFAGDSHGGRVSIKEWLLSHEQA